VVNKFGNTILGIKNFNKLVVSTLNNKITLHEFVLFLSNHCDPKLKNDLSKILSKALQVTKIPDNSIFPGVTSIEAELAIEYLDKREYARLDKYTCNRDQISEALKVYVQNSSKNSPSKAGQKGGNSPKRNDDLQETIDLVVRKLVSKNIKPTLEQVCKSLKTITPDQTEYPAFRFSFEGNVVTFDCNEGEQLRKKRSLQIYIDRSKSQN